MKNKKKKGRKVRNTGGIKGKCKLCGRKTFLQKHHIIKKSKWKKSKIGIYLCQKCHSNLHKKETKNET